MLLVASPISLKMLATRSVTTDGDESYKPKDDETFNQIHYKDACQQIKLYVINLFLFINDYYPYEISIMLLNILFLILVINMILHYSYYFLIILIFSLPIH